MPLSIKSALEYLDTKEFFGQPKFESDRLKTGTSNSTLTALSHVAGEESDYRSLVLIRVVRLSWLLDTRTVTSSPSITWGTE